MGFKYKQQFKSVLIGNKKSIYRKFLKLLFTLLFSPFFIPILLIIRIISPIILIRFDTLFSSRIGHFALNTELYLCRKDVLKSKNNLYIFDIACLHSNYVCNEYLLKLWKEKILILNRFFLIPFIYYNQFLPNSEKHTFYGNFENTRDTENLLDETKAHINFSEHEIQHADGLLERMGINKKDKIIALIIRDSAYLEQIHPLKDDSSHDYRNSDLQNYFDTALFLANNGFFVIRVGSKVKKPFPIIHERIIDYANSDLRSEFLDIYIAYRCEFTISSGTGWDSLPMIFRKPILFVNIAPVGYQYTFSKKYINITKHYFDLYTNKYISLNQIFKRKLATILSNEDFINNKVKLIENSSQEILEATKEMLSFIENKYIQDFNKIYLQKLYWKSFDINIKSPISPFHLHGKIKSKVGDSFLNFYFNNNLI